MVPPLPLYSGFEEHWQTAFHRIKAQQLAPLLRLLTRLRITAMHVSILSASLTWIGLFLALARGEFVFFVLFLALHLLLDGLDGPLARHQRTENLGGTLIDALCDHSGIVATSVFIATILPSLASAALWFAMLYTAVVALSILLTLRGRRPFFVIRPRLYLYGAIAADQLFGIFVTPWVLQLCIAALLVSLVLCVIGLLPRT